MFASSLPFEVSRQSIRVRAMQSIRSMPIVLLAALLITWALMSQVPLVNAASWLIPVCLTAIVNRIRCQKILAAQATQQTSDGAASAPNHYPMDEQIRVAQRELFWFTIVNEVAMSTGIWWIALENSDIFLWFLVTLVQCVYTLGAMINASSHPRTFISGAAINIGSLTLFWTLQGGQGIVVGISLIGVFVLLSRLAMQLRRDFEQTIKIRMENQALVESLKREREYSNVAWSAAEKSSLARSRYFAAASHDLRQPLHTLMLFTDMLNTQSAQQQLVFVQQIQRAAATLNAMFTSLIDISKLDAGAIQPMPGEIDVVDFMRPLIDELRANAQERGLNCEVRIDSISVVSDQLLLARIIRNLLDNAVKYTHNGSVQVEVAARQTAGDGGEAVAVFTITDTGIGIPLHEQDRVFDEFVQLDDPAQSADKGNGLGLAIVKRLGILLEHPIQLTSTPQRGTRVTIEVPVHSTHTSLDGRRSRGVELNPSLSGARVLVIDDAASVRDAMAAQLHAWHCTPILAAGIGEALATMADPRFAPQIVIADFNLGRRENGFDAIRALRRLNPDLPCAIFTGETAAFWQDATRDRDVPIFQKPVSPHAIRGWLQQTLQTN